MIKHATAIQKKPELEKFRSTEYAWSPKPKWKLYLIALFVALKLTVIIWNLKKKTHTLEIECLEWSFSVKYIMYYTVNIVK